MSDEKKTMDGDQHRKIAAELFNLVWELMEKADRSAGDDDRMLHAAHASRFHWGEVGTPLEFERGEWQISRVYAILGRAEPALFHAERCLSICESNKFADFDIAFAYEAMARAHAVAGAPEAARKYIALGEEAAEQIEESGNRDYFLSELKTVTALLD